MTRFKALRFLLVLVLAAFSISCSGPKTGGVVGGGGTGSVSVTMVTDTLPAHPSMLTFQVTITSITFTPSSGTATTINLNPALMVDLMRLQSDTVFLGSFTKVPAAQYKSVTLTITGSASITFLNDTNATIAGCPANTICPFTVAASSNPVVTVSFVVSKNTVTGIGVDLNLANAVSVSGANLVVNFSNANVLSAFTLPRTGSNLAAGQLDLIEDFTGATSITNQSVTITSAATTGRGSLTASTTPSTAYDPDPTGTHCPTGTTQLANCVLSNQIASMDVILKSDGTLAIQEIEPLITTQEDVVEGIVVSINQSNSTQFTLIAKDLIPFATNTLIGGLHIGDGLTVNIPNAKNFLVDTKGLPVASQFAGNLGNFTNANNTTAIHLGQTVAVHVTTFTPAAGSTLASCTSDTVTLRWTRFSPSVSTASSPAFNITAFPSFFNLAGSAQVQSFAGTQGADGVTNLDGISSTGNLVQNKPVGLRALFIENPGDTLVPAFYAAKVRQH